MTFSDLNWLLMQFQLVFNLFELTSYPKMMKLTPVIESPNFLQNNHFRVIFNISLHAMRRLLGNHMTIKFFRNPKTLYFCGIWNPLILFIFHKMASFSRLTYQNHAFLGLKSRNHAFSVQNNHYAWPKHELRIEPGTSVHACICINTIISCTLTNILFYRYFDHLNWIYFVTKSAVFCIFVVCPPLEWNKEPFFLFRTELFRVYNGPIRVYFRIAL